MFNGLDAPSRESPARKELPMNYLSSAARALGLAAFVAGTLFTQPALSQDGRCCPCDIDGSGEVNSADDIRFTDAFMLGESVADMNGDGKVTGDDFKAFQECWKAGCPCLDEPMVRGSAIITTDSCKVYLGASTFACQAPVSPCYCRQILIQFNEVIWSVCVMNKGRKGLAIGRVYMKSPYISGSRQILKELSLAELFVPYHDDPAYPQDPAHPPYRPYDTNFCTGPLPGCSLDVLSANQLPAAAGALLTLSGDTAPRAIVEVRDYGIAWLCKQTTSSIRRGAEVVIWGILDGDNYDNIVEYHFRDDGRIQVRMGNTGYNSNLQPLQGFVPHMHDALWRIDMDLAGPLNDVPSRTIHTEPTSPSLPLHATDSAFAGYHEEAFRWIEDEFTTVLVEDLFVTNTYGNPIGYELQPWDRKGASRHFGFGDNWTQYDFWVTAFHPGEDGSPYTTNCTVPDSWASANCPHLAPDIYLGINGYLDPSEVFPVPVPDTVLWYHSSAHHDVSDEDRALGDPANEVRGVTLVHWHGFDLVPHNFFNANPLGGPLRCGN
jgi:Cu2+-containing amine oxidase